MERNEKKNEKNETYVKYHKKTEIFFFLQRRKKKKTLNYILQSEYKFCYQNISSNWFTSDVMQKNNRESNCSWSLCEITYFAPNTYVKSHLNILK